MDFNTLDLLLKCGMQFSHRRIRNTGLTNTECLICSYVGRTPGCTQEETARSLRLDKTTAAKAIGSLEAKGILCRARDTGDRRRKILALTEEGAERVRDISDTHDRWLKSVLGTLSEREQEEFEDYCRRLLRAAENMLENKDGNDDA